MTKARKKQVIILIILIAGILGISAFYFINLANKKVDFQKTIGRWLRTDGDYTLEILKIHENNSIDAAYYNPKPIHIAKSELRQEGNKMIIFVELRDIGYPGSTYTLDYDPKQNMLLGIYYHAPSRQNFNVFFTRSSH